MMFGDGGRGEFGTKFETKFWGEEGLRETTKLPMRFGDGGRGEFETKFRVSG